VLHCDYPRRATTAYHNNDRLAFIGKAAFSCPDLSARSAETATNGSGKAMPKGTFDRSRKQSVWGLGLAPTSASGMEKDIPMTCLPVPNRILSKSWA